MADKSTVPSFKMMMKPVLKVLSEAGQLELPLPRING